VDKATVGGIALALLALLVMMGLEGADPSALLLPPALVLVFGATFGATLAGSTWSDVRRLGSWLRMGFRAVSGPSPAQTIPVLVELATVARKEGLLPLENEVRRVSDPFLRHGMQLAVDGTPAEQLRTVLEREIESRRREDRTAAAFFLKMGGYAPTIGIIGTVVGLIQALNRLDQVDALGSLIAAAFVATLWGVLSANVLWIPLSKKITRNADVRTAQMELVVAGILEIEAGASPRALQRRLRSMLPPSVADRLAA
jgi:chemotaxis protein MotA